MDCKSIFNSSECSEEKYYYYCDIFDRSQRHLHTEAFTKNLIHKVSGQGDFGDFGVIGEGAGVLYALTRMMCPSIVVETGVGAGHSTSIILQALHDNNHGVLYSIDLPIYRGDDVPYPKFRSFTPNGFSSGWGVPENLECRWRLSTGPSKEELPKLLSNINKIDLFLHDSEHSYYNMLLEYELAWKHLNSDGVMLSDDVRMPNKADNDVGNPFYDFCDDVGIIPCLIGRIGLIKKTLV